MKKLPHEIEIKAYITPGAKEYAWRRIDLDHALNAIVKSGQAILGGEVWLVKNSTEHWIGLIPSRYGEPPGVWSWDTDMKKEDETWNEYCKRTLSESIKSLSELMVEDEAALDVLSFIWFNVCFVEEHEV